MVPIAALALASCAKDKTALDQTQTQVQQPSASVGSIVGRVTASRDGAPLSGIVVSTVQPSGTVSATTDASGAYALTGLSAGALYEVRFAKVGYVARFGNALIPDQFGDAGTVYPRGNGVVEFDMEMALADATVQGIVILKDAAPAPGAVLTVDLTSSGYDLVVQKTAGADGSFSFTGLPGTLGGLPIRIVSAPYTSTGSALPEYGVVTVSATTYPATTTRADVDLRTAALGLALVYSDVDAGVHALTPALTFTFNNGLALTYTSATLTDLTAAQTLPTALSLDTTGAVLTVGTVGTPAPAFVDQHQYQVTVRAMSASDKLATVTRSFLASGSAFTVPPPVTNLAITSPANVDYNTTTLGLSWSASLGAATYAVYARDTGRNTGYVLVKSVAAPVTSTVTTSVTLPAAFDSIVGDAAQTPFGGGTAVTLVVVPIDADGASGAFTTQTSTIASDKTSPAVAVVSASPTPDNAGGATPKAVRLTIAFSEPMDKTVTPTLTLSNFSPTFTPTFANWAWLNGTSVSVDFEVPAATSAAGALLTVGGAKDASGNALVAFTGQLAAWNPVLNPGFESALANWSIGGTSPLVSLTTSSHSGVYAVWLGSTGASIGNTSSVSQTFTLPAGATSLSFYYKVVCTDSLFYDWATATLIDNTTAVTTTILPKVCSNTGAWQQLSWNVAANAGHSVTLTLTSHDDGSVVTYTLFDDVLVQ
jgi:hypothetical protein